MKASYALSVGVLATILAALAVRCSDGHAADQALDAIALDGIVAYLYDHAAGTLRLEQGPKQ